DQPNLDNPHKDLLRARACGQSMIPTSTGAAKALGEVMPHLNSKLHGMALRVPTPNVSLVDLVVDLKEDVTVKDVNNVFKNEYVKILADYIRYTEESLVSSAFATTSESTNLDTLSTFVIEDNKVKELAWYDNEFGYSSRVVHLARHVGKSL